MKNFRIYWVNGRSEEAKGKSLSEALSSLGYGLGTAKAIKKWEIIP